MKVTWCEIRTVIQALQTNSCNMVLRCRRRVRTRIIIQQNARFEKPRSLFPNVRFNFDRVSQYLPRSIDGSNLQKKPRTKVNASSACKALKCSGKAF
ncbi:hypothetical protein TNCV_4053091 [Trichonephila clavipes]|nr:hypothetical protein TNCV_4053091 [Trichonephila clavipes]